MTALEHPTGADRLCRRAGFGRAEKGLLRFSAKGLSSAGSSSTAGGNAMKVPHLRLRWPSAAMVVACIALTIALAPASYATVSLLLPAESVGTAQLKMDAVTSNKVRDFSLRRWDFKKGDLQGFGTLRCAKARSACRQDR
jgi:hypothetical protein